MTRKRRLQKIKQAQALVDALRQAEHDLEFRLEEAEARLSAVRYRGPDRRTKAEKARQRFMSNLILKNLTGANPWLNFKGRLPKGCGNPVVKLFRHAP